jgi:hypothetical protein
MMDLKQPTVSTVGNYDDFKITHGFNRMALWWFKIARGFNRVLL